MAAKKILVVEDEDSILKLVRKILSRDDCEIVETVDGEEAFAEIQKDHFDLIVCDYRLPKMDGRVLYEKIREVKPECAKRFLFITGSTYDDELGQFFKDNEIPHLLKPFRKEHLLGLATRMIQSFSHDLSE